jgi:hypothetical protein
MLKRFLFFVTNFLSNEDKIVEFFAITLGANVMKLFTSILY